MQLFLQIILILAIVGLVKAIIFVPRTGDGEPGTIRESAIAFRAIWLAAVLVFITLRSPETITRMVSWAAPDQGGESARAAGNAFVQTTAPRKRAASGADAIIDGIRRDFQRIEALGPGAHQHTIALEGFSTEGGEARVYFEGGRVAKIAARHLGETGRTSEDYYFRGNSLIFVFRKASTYDQPFGNVQNTEEDRFYFDRNRMVRWRGGDQRLVARAHPAYADEETRNLSFGAALLAAARSYAPALAASE
ncbi:MAG TPA: hypothetical protein VGB92_12985 [Longimicrobium sp.]|jgi:hypothetical protein